MTTFRLRRPDESSHSASLGVLGRAAQDQLIPALDLEISDDNINVAPFLR